MIDYSQAVLLMRQEIAPLDVEWKAFGPALLGRVLATPMVSDMWLPPFDNSSMDGFAVNTRGLGLPEGSEVAVRGWQAAGDPQQQANKGAWEIMTGARIPDGMDAVVPVEQIEVLTRDQERPTTIRIGHAVTPGQFIRRRGADIVAGCEVIGAGTELRAQDIMVLSALGVDRLQVRRRPRVAVITTGRELVGEPLQALQSGQIRDSNRPFLLAQLQSAGAEVVCQSLIGDEPLSFQHAIDRALALGVDLIVSSGAVSAGRYDFIPGALRERGARIIFHKVAVFPGKPLLLAELPGGVLHFGLPGNPMSTAAGVRFFVEPALRTMLGQAQEEPLRIPLKYQIVKSPALRLHARARVICSDAGMLQVEILPGQESFRMLPLLCANAWAAISEGIAGVASGDPVEVYGLGHRQPVQLAATSYDVN